MLAADGDRTLVLAHGAGSTADFLRRAFPARQCGARMVPVEHRSGDVREIAAALLRAAAGCRGPVLLGGVSIGAHAAALAALTAPPRLLAGCVLALPAWSGPAPAGSPTALAAAEVADLGPHPVLRRLLEDPSLREDWVTAELLRAWQDRPGLAAELAAAAAAPALADLGRLAVPALVLALTGDPVHPRAVAQAWAEAIPDADLAEIERAAPGRDLAVFGRTVGAWIRSRCA